MAWVRGGQIPVAIGAHPWSVAFAQCPTPLRIDETTIRIYYSTRDAENRTRPAFIDVDAESPERIGGTCDSPCMDLGALGTFDDSGVMPSCAVRDRDRVLLYYAGWNTSTTVPYRISIGVAESRDGGRRFERIFEGPILDRTTDEPHFCSTPFVRYDGRLWEMWYLSCLGWEMIDGRPEPQYLIRGAVSSDGVAWGLRGMIMLPLDHRHECVARPWVVRSGNLWEMWYCDRSRNGYRSDKNKSYRIGRATSVEGITWTREAARELDVAPEGWDSEMTAYPAVYKHGGTRYLLYNGNGFGKGGFGYAVWKED